jgi:hypothetical protein
MRKCIDESCKIKQRRPVKGGQNSNLRTKTLINLHETCLTRRQEWNFKEHLALKKKKSP